MNKPNNHVIRGIYTIIDTSIIPINKVDKTARMILKGGGRIIQLRAKGHQPKDTLDAAERLKKIVSASGGTFLVNDRLDIALLSKADGVHLGQDDIPCHTAREISGKDFIIGISTHNMEEAATALKDGADYIGFGPIFSTPTKSEAAEPRGVEQLKELISEIDIPTVAIGGINDKNIEDVFDTGASAVAMVSNILNSKDICAKVKRLVSVAGSKNILPKRARSEI